MTNPQRRLRHGQRPTEKLDWSDTASQSQAVPSELASRLRGIAEDPMLADHVHISKSTLMAAVAEIDRLSHSAATGKVPEGLREKLRELADAYRRAPLVFKTGEPSHIDVAQDAIVEYVAATRPTNDHLWDETIRDRDTYHEWADKLAEAISKYFGAYIGEHSNTNCPWAEALEAIESVSPAAPLAGKADELRSALQEFVDYHTKPAGMTVEIATDKAKCREFMADVDTRHSKMVQRAQALLSAPLAAAVPAEEALVEPDNLPRWIDNLKGLDPTIDALIEYIIKQRTPAEPAPILASALTDERVYEIVAAHEIPRELFGHAVFDADGVLKLCREIEQEGYRNGHMDGMAEGARLSTPTAQGTAQSIDTPEFRELLDAYTECKFTRSRSNPESFKAAFLAYEELVNYINRHIAAQAPAGRDAKAEHEAGFAAGWNEALATARADVRELQNNLETFGPYGEESARVALDGALDAIDDLKSHAAEQTSGGEHA